MAGVEIDIVAQQEVTEPLGPSDAELDPDRLLVVLDRLTAAGTPESGVVVHPVHGSPAADTARFIVVPLA
jgi:hypothetical protein